MKTSIQNVYPLSPMQGGLLFQSIYQPEVDDYFIQSIYEIEGEIDTGILQRAWKEVVNR